MSTKEIDNDEDDQSKPITSISTIADTEGKERENEGEGETKDMEEAGEKGETKESAEKGEAKESAEKGEAKESAEKGETKESAGKGEAKESAEKGEANKSDEKGTTKETGEKGEAVKETVGDLPTPSITAEGEPPPSGDISNDEKDDGDDELSIDIEADIKSILGTWKEKARLSEEPPLTKSELELALSTISGAAVAEGSLTIHDNSENIPKDLDADEGGDGSAFNHIEILHDNRETFKDNTKSLQQLDGLKKRSNDDTDVGDITAEGDDEEATLHLASSQDFFENVMTIPDEFAEARLSLEALAKDVKDPTLKRLEIDFVNKGADVEDEESTSSSIDWSKYESKQKPVQDRCPSVESFFRQHEWMEVNFYLFPGKKMLSKETRLDTNIYQLKAAISRYVRVGPDRLDLRRNFNLIPDNRTLKDLGGKAGKKMRFTVEVNRRIPPNKFNDGQCPGK